MFWRFIAMVLIIRIVLAVLGRMNFNALKFGFITRPKYVPGLFMNNYVDSKVLFMMRFKHVPSVSVITQIDVTAAYAFLTEKLGSEMVRIYQTNMFDHSEGKSFFNMTIVELRNNRMLELGNGYVEVYYTHAHTEWARSLIGELAAFHARVDASADKAPTVIGFARAMEMN